MLKVAPADSHTLVDPKHDSALDGIRGLAILLVLLSHAADFLGPIPHGNGAPMWGIVTARILVPGWGGVDLFFTLSGFLITGILLRSKGRPTYFRSFYARRALRIFPIYYFVLILLCVLGPHSRTLTSLLPPTGLQRVSYFFYVANWPVFWSSWAGMSGLLGAYWSLSVEEQFYLVWPTLVRFVKPTAVLWLCGAGFILGWVERGLLVQHFGLKLGILQWPFSRLDGLFLGAALAIYRFRQGKPIPIRWALTTFGAGAAIYAWIAIAHTTELAGAERHLWQSGVTAFALMSAGLLATAEHKGIWVHRVLSWIPLRLLGRYSYGIYIYHLFFYNRLGDIYASRVQLRFGDSSVIAFGYIAFTILLVFAVAALSFRFIEEPILRLKRHFPSPAPAV